MLLAYLLLLTGLTISAVAIYYSVVGLAAIFSAAVIPIIVMGSALEVAKLVCASWLKANWERAPALMKVYMTIAVIVLMLITSMGIFGFLSKAHSDQSLVSGDVLAKISIYDEKIKTEKENIEANRKALKQMDEAVDQSMARSTTEQGANRAVAIRQQQARERTRLQNEITASQKKIASLNDERAPIAAEVRKVEAEVGPLKYIAAFIYGETDETILEKAVTWVIITIIIVFDPLAVIMLLAAQMTFGWHTRNRYALAEEKYPTIADLDRDVGEKPTAEELAPEPDPAPWPFVVKEEPKIEEPKIESEVTEKTQEESDLEKWNKMIAEAEKAVEEEESDQQIMDKEKDPKNHAAMTKWKAENPEDSLKRQRQLLDRGVINTLPWEVDGFLDLPPPEGKFHILPELIKPDFPVAEENSDSKKK